MIGKLDGIVESVALEHVIIDVRGVGYVVYCSERTLAALPAVGERVSLHTDLLVREDLLQLFGFTTLRERDLHRMMLGVPGVGVKASLAVLGKLGVDGAVEAIALGNWQSVKAAHGVGPRLAQRIVNELGDRVSALMASGAMAPPTAAPGSASADALSALINLGWQQAQAARVIAEAARAEPEADSSQLIRAALKSLAPAS